jgi:dinuclear metal center YbgI/SA1388 family protein
LVNSNEFRNFRTSRRYEMLSLQAVMEQLDQLAPLHLAEDWDNVGLLIGERTKQVERIMTCLTVTPESAAEAVDQQADLIISHHPMLFRPVQRLTDSSAEGRMILGLVRGGVAVYSPHTAFDNVPGGINDLLAQRLGLTAVSPLRPGQGIVECKIAIFLPETDLAKVSSAVFAAGAGHIGQYRECSFRTAGTGTFFGLDSTNPAVGQKGRREEVSELRLEVVCPANCVDQVIQAMRGAHSYEEPAFDVYPLRPKSSHIGAGRIGKLATPMSLAELSAHAKQALNAAQMQLVGESKRTILTVAIACGAGGDFLPDAIRAGVDVFLTGELRFHDYLAAKAQDIALLLPGHYATERPGIEDLAQRLQTKWPSIRVWASHRECDPLASC